MQHAYQGRTSANRYAERAIAALKEDWRLSAQYEGMLDGKWKQYVSCSAFFAKLADSRRWSLG